MINRKHLVAAYATLGAWTIVSVFPLFTMLLIALKPRDVFLQIPPDYLSWRFTLENFRTILADPRWGGFYANTIAISIAAATLSVVAGAPAAYAFARHRFALDRFLLVFILALQMIPATSIIVPLYNMFAVLRVLDSFAPLILIHGIGSMPLVIWLLRGYFLTIPRSLEEAAEIDGCTKVETIRHVTLPIAAPGAAAAFVYSFVRAFNDYIIARTLAGGEVVTYTVGLTFFTNQHEGIDMHMVSAASFTALAPVILMFMLFHRYFVIGLAGGAVKA